MMKAVAAVLAAAVLRADALHLRGKVFTLAANASSTAKCDAVACKSMIDAHDICPALKANDFEKLEAAFQDAEFAAACGADACEAVGMEHCFPNMNKLTCPACAEKFSDAGGCKVIRDQVLQKTHLTDDEFARRVVEKIPEGCFPCSEEAMLKCIEDLVPPPQNGTCEACVDAIDKHHMCHDLASSSKLEDIPADVVSSCSTLDCNDEIMQHCQANTCHTVKQGDSCFTHVRWAMQVGIQTWPEWYPHLDKATATFEDFQWYLHATSPHDCPMPCAHKIDICHTAVPGESCHAHVKWAMDHGIHAVPQWYSTPGLTKDSSFQEFQAWLHRLHHGDCPRPCSD